MGKIYPEMRAKIAANRATAGERAMHNKAVDEAKLAKDLANRRAFKPRKSSHKQG